jgi:signal transduction histidine kinase
MSSAKIVVFMTLCVLFFSVVFVYLFYSAFDVPYSLFDFLLSVVLPLLLSPPTIYLVLKLTKHLKEYKLFLDVEIQKNREKELIMYEQARFALMGEMLANISHQWKQPLNTINLSVVSTRFSLYDPKAVEKCFDVVENNVNYLATTINDFLSYFDNKQYQETKRVPAIISEIKSIYETTLLENGITFTVELKNGAENILLASSVTQVLLNLLSNAKDAMAGQETQKTITLRITACDGMVEIKCCDSGEGVPDEIVANIFDPYFTTKEKTRGTGLGLYMSKQIVHSVFDGEIYVQRTHPSCFVVELPCGKNCLLEGE